MTNPHLKAAFLDIFESVGYSKERLKERLNKFKELENSLKGTDYTFWGSLRESAGNYVKGK